MAPASLASSPVLRHRRTLSSTLIDESVGAAAELVHRWHPDTHTTTASSLFLHSDDHSLFLGATADLHRAMLFFASTAASNSGSIVQAQELLQTAMRRLDLELRLLLHHLDDHHHFLQGQGQVQVATFVTTSMISSIVRAMMAAGYGKECLSTFKSCRRAALATKLQRLLLPGHHNLNSLNKLAWDQVDDKIIQPWLAAAAVAFNSLFAAEKELCDAVFAGDEHDGVGEAVFAAIADDQATGLVAVAEAAVSRARRAPERLFRVLDVHNTLAAEVMPAILSVFANKDSAVATRAARIITKAAEAARGALAGFEAAILHKEPSKATSPGGGVHPLTRYVTNYLVFLADYEDGNERHQQLAVDTSAWVRRLVSSLLSKLESKAGSYREAALSYLFLANNTHYVATKVRGSGKLQVILGEGWAEAHFAKARGHVQVFVRAAWGKVLAMISSSSPSPYGAARGREMDTSSVEAAVMEAVAMQDQWMAADKEMARALRMSATATVVPKYRMFYRRYGAAVSLTPGDLTTMIAALFTGTSSSESVAIPRRTSSFLPDVPASISTSSFI